MTKKYLIVIGGLLAALLVVGVIGATNAFAQGSNAAWMNGRGPGSGGHGFGLGQAELEAAAKVLGMTTDELSTALQSGSTLQDLADKAGVDIADVQAAIQAAHITEVLGRITQAVTDGTITQANADWLLEGLDKGYIGGRNAFDFGGPRGGHGGFDPQGTMNGNGPQGLGNGNAPATQTTP